MLLDLRAMWHRVALTDLTVDCTTLRGTREVLCELDKLTVGELVKNLHNFTDSNANHHVQKADLLQPTCRKSLRILNYKAYVYTTSLTFNNSTFCPHSVFMCFVWI
jgi:hypothetical protein